MVSERHFKCLFNNWSNIRELFVSTTIFVRIKEIFLYGLVDSLETVVQNQVVTVRPPSVGLQVVTRTE